MKTDNLVKKKFLKIGDFVWSKIFYFNQKNKEYFLGVFNSVLALHFSFEKYRVPYNQTETKEQQNCQICSTSLRWNQTTLIRWTKNTGFSKSRGFWIILLSCLTAKSFQRSIQSWTQGKNACVWKHQRSFSLTIS